ncbi:cold-shock protein [Nocardiopsis rhodophaea]|uniref:Cold-shock protein n=1 Tax=Nocardiopsis rhodophaea TaxID=280238 RepID=A0ABN2T6F4_9ACTN
MKWFDAEARYGIIAPDSEGDDVFVHDSGIKFPGSGLLEAGQQVEFELVEADRGPHAQRVRVLEEQEEQQDQ